MHIISEAEGNFPPLEANAKNCLPTSSLPLALVLGSTKLNPKSGFPVSHNPNPILGAIRQ